MNNLLAIVWIIAAVAIVGLGFYLYSRIGNRRKPAKPIIPPVAPKTPEQELSALGILEIRPKTKESAETVEEAVADQLGKVEEIVEFEQELEPEPPPAPERPSMAPYSKGPIQREKKEEPAKPVAPAPKPVEPSPQRVKASATSSPRSLPEVLEAARAALGGHTAVFVKRLEKGRYWIEGMVSDSDAVQVQGSFEMHEELDEAAQKASTVAVFDVGSAYVPLEALGYYQGTAAVRQFAMAPVRIPENDAQYALIVDALAWHDLDEPWQRLLFSQFATLIGTLMAVPAPPEDEDAQGPRVRSRREIIQEEMEQARKGVRPLALALIHLNRAEAIAAAGEQAVGEAEQELAMRIGNATPESRLERFGELTYGVFRPEEVAEVEAWAVQLENDLDQTNGLLAGGVSIGIALLRDRHEGPDDFREDAHAALREAFETGTCTIIE